MSARSLIRNVCTWQWRWRLLYRGCGFVNTRVSESVDKHIRNPHSKIPVSVVCALCNSNVHIIIIIMMQDSADDVAALSWSICFCQESISNLQLGSIQFNQPSSPIPWVYTNCYKTNNTLPLLWNELYLATYQRVDADSFDYFETLFWIMIMFERHGFVGEIGFKINNKHHSK